MKTLMENWNRFVNEEEDTGNTVLAEADRKAGQSIPSQIMRLDPNFKFDKQPTRGSDERLMVLQDIEGNTATVFNYEGEVMGTGLDLNSSPKWFDSIVRYSPGLVKASMREKYGR